ncbi:MAG: hypothetical protein R3E12_14835 [Candidatus Eisenbacteria bacterium]|uniref:Uncharacterized protein n=1 Tax=Eiseniibacteriota bacterium TaxID=2212470 RepID=A0A956LWS0_UNCEI|nr:hypothetical protein [Candidatus Eisenbacteria bacterium]
MLRRFLDLLYGSVPGDFPSAYGIDESIQRLSAVTDRGRVFDFPRHEVAVGHVSRDRVSLYRVNPRSQNSLKPHYTGEFREVDARVVLVGRFGMHRWARAFMTVWLGFCAVWTTVAAGIVVVHDASVWWLPLAGLLMLTFGVTFVAFGKRLSRDDVPWLSRVIQSALSK